MQGKPHNETHGTVFGLDAAEKSFVPLNSLTLVVMERAGETLVTVRDSYSHAFRPVVNSQKHARIR
jgi:hypothetical protein